MFSPIKVIIFTGFLFILIVFQFTNAKQHYPGKCINSANVHSCEYELCKGNLKNAMEK